MAAPPKKFLNDPTDAVSEFIDGLLLTYPNRLRRLEGHDVVLADPLPPTGEVRILSGGGSGHEPSHAGWIGPGMLTGAVLGGMFASPSVKSILAAIRAVTPVADENDKSDAGGCLLVVKNYTGDRLNFGMACELANAEGRRTRMVVVADDCALPRSRGVIGARGVAGTVLVHKVAGAAASRGRSLNEVAELATWTASRIGSLGVTLEAVTIPGAAARNDRLDGDRIEIGLGIHGEAGIRQSPMLSADEVAGEMLRTIHDYGFYNSKRGEVGNDGKGELYKLQPGDEVVVMVNNLGGTSNFELSILARSLVQYLEGEMKCVATRVYVGPFMTSFNMHGASVSVLCIDEEGELAALLDASADAPAWVKADVLTTSPRPSLVPIPDVGASSPGAASTTEAAAAVDIKEETVAIDDFATLASAAISAACAAVVEAVPQLTAWDTVVGDGDCGITMARGAKEVKRRLDDGAIPTASPSGMFLALADAVSASMGGTSGVLFELMFRRMANSLAESQRGGIAVNGEAMAGAFADGVEALTFYGGAREGSSTMMDALCPAADASRMGLAAIAKASADGADDTVGMTEASAGRSTYLSEEQLRGTPDPGAKAVATILGAVASAYTITPDSTAE